MKFLLLLMSLTFMPQTYAQQVPWPDNLAMGKLVSFDQDGSLGAAYTAYPMIQMGWKDVEDLMQKLFNVPKVKISFEYIQYRSGVLVVGIPEYARGGNFPDDSPEMEALFAKAQARQLKATDLKGPKWIHLVQPIDTEEANCLALSVIDGKIGGCADQWQGGLTEDKVVCYKNMTYVKCHIDCIEKLYNRKIDVQPGYCPEVE